MKGFIEIQLDENCDFELWEKDETIIISLSEITAIRKTCFGCDIYVRSNRVHDLDYAPSIASKTSYEEIKRLIQEATNG